MFDIDKVLLALHVLHAVIPVGCFTELAFQRYHLEGRTTSLGISGTYVNTVATTQAIHNTYLHAELHTLHGGRSLHFERSGVQTCSFGFVHNERTDTSVRTNEGTLVTLDTVISFPCRNESCYTALFVSGSTLRPSTILNTLECADGEQVTILSVDRTNYFVDESGVVVSLFLISGEVSPSGINGKLLVLATTVNGCVVLVHDIFTLLAIRLHDELLHLLDSEVNGDNLGNAEEGALKDGVGTITKADFLSNLGGVDIVNGDVVFSEVLLHIVRQVSSQLIAFPNSVQKEGAVLLKTTCYVVHLQVSLYVASYEVGCSHQVS